MAIVLERSKHCFRLVENGTNQTEIAFRGSSLELKSKEGPETYFCHWDIEENNPGVVQILNKIETQQNVCQFAGEDGEDLDTVYEEETGWDEDGEDEEGDDLTLTDEDIESDEDDDEGEEDVDGDDEDDDAEDEE